MKKYVLIISVIIVMFILAGCSEVSDKPVDVDKETAKGEANLAGQGFTSECEVTCPYPNWLGDNWCDDGSPGSYDPKIKCYTEACGWDEGDCKEDKQSGPYCTDSDGDDIMVKGVVESHYASGDVAASYPDSCVDANTVEEVTCYGTQPVATNYKCENGCKDGACKKSLELQKCNTVNDCDVTVKNPSCIDNLNKGYNFCMGDDDNDGVLNNQPDTCPNSPKGEIVTQYGCGVQKLPEFGCSKLLVGDSIKGSNGDKIYDVDAIYIDKVSVKFIVNGKVTNKIQNGGYYSLGDGKQISVSQITYQSFAGGEHSVEFCISDAMLPGCGYVLEGGSTKVSNGDKIYDVNATYIDNVSAKFQVNDELTNKLQSGDTYSLGDGKQISVSQVLYQSYAGGEHSVEFCIYS